MGFIKSLLRYENFNLWLQGGMSNELYNTIARVTDGIYEGIECMWLKFKDAFRDVGII